MPNKPSGAKALRQSKKHAAANLKRKEAFKDAIKSTLRSKTATEALKPVIQAQKALDKAAKVGTIKKNTAARKLSRLMAKVNKMGKKK